ncbi:MAG: hypothetical protein PWQ91_1691 [Eubacteriales bacterium]|nr:hypothetical protein [Eubacteriales bacterium]
MTEKSRLPQGCTFARRYSLFVFGVFPFASKNSRSRKKPPKSWLCLLENSKQQKQDKFFLGKNTKKTVDCKIKCDSIKKIEP